MGRIFIIILVLAAVVGGCSYFGSYNNMVDMEQKVEAQWSNVEVQYQRRADLIPNLVQTAKAAAEVEKQIFTDIAAARSNVANFTVDKSILDNPERLKQFQQLQGELSGALSRLIAVQERYPDLKSNAQFTQLANSLERTENRISQERRKFNGTVQEYNSYIKKLPNNIWAGFGGFQEKAFFEATQGTETAPKVNFDN
ncbi:MAG: LemA family protein [Bacteroidia bacterium]|nr:LemA family protein [Bacteroidia bacterium]